MLYDVNVYRDKNFHYSICVYTASEKKETISKKMQTAFDVTAFKRIICVCSYFFFLHSFVVIFIYAVYISAIFARIHSTVLLSDSMEG